VLSLPSWNEGTPNVVLEALAAGRRVVATSVGGIPDLLSDPLLGELTPARDPASLARALGKALTTEYDPKEIAAKAPAGSWEDSASALRAVLEGVLSSDRKAAPEASSARPSRSAGVSEARP
jgi:teichuronic acid biosynthesis glycosyltransferase TuaC